MGKNTLGGKVLGEAFWEEGEWEEKIDMPRIDLDHETSRKYDKKGMESRLS